MKCTLDASVWLASALEGEPAHHASCECLDGLRRARARFIQPPFFLVEVAATVARRTGQAALGLAALEAALTLPRLEIADWSSALNARAAALAAERRLRAGDACYLAVATMTGSTLVTLDRELLERARDVATVRSPSEWLASPGT